MDFTFSIYKKLLIAFNEVNYDINGVFNNNKSAKKSLILRHDVDRFPKQTLQMARLEYKMGVSSTYYFRIVKSVFKDNILKEIVDLGHEIGYHYEDLALSNGNFDKAIVLFENNLNKVRKYYPVKTICMHGSPLSPWDNKKIWEKYDYKKFGIIIDTSLDINYDEVYYLTDNGFGWNRTNTSIRDKVKSRYTYYIKNTEHLISLLYENKLPDKIMINAHPDTFFDPGIKWLLNFSFIKSKNTVKWIVIKSGIIK